MYKGEKDMKLKCLITCKIGNDTYKTGEIYELPELTAKQQLQSSDYFKSVNKLHRVFFDKIVEEVIVAADDSDSDTDNNLTE